MDKLFNTRALKDMSVLSKIFIAVVSIAVSIFLTLTLLNYPVIFLGIIIFCVLLYIFPKQKIIFWCMVFFLPFTNIGILDIGITMTLSKVLIILLCLNYAIHVLLYNKHRFEKLYTDKFLLYFFLAIIVISFLKEILAPAESIGNADVNILRSVHFRYLTQIFNLGLMISVYFFTSQIVRDKIILVKTINIILFSTFLVSIYGLYQFIGSFFSWPFTFIGQGTARPSYVAAGIIRVNSTFPEGKHFAFFLIPVVLMLFNLLITRQEKWGVQYKYYFLMIFFLVIFILTFSRSAWIMLLISFIIIILFIFKMKNTKKTMKTTIILFLMIITIFFALNNLEVQWINLFKNRLKEISYTQWTQSIDHPKIKAAWYIFKEHPFFGVGYGNYPFYLIKGGWLGDWMTSTKIHVAPNQFLMILVETGIVGLCLFLMFFLGTIRYSMGMIKKMDQFWQNFVTSFLFASIGFFVILQYDTQLNQPFFWFFLGMLSASVKISLKENI